jgi:hypothetical protein
MMALSIQLGAKVQRRNYNGMDTPGSVVRLNDVEAMVFWPDDDFYEIIPVTELESYDAMRDLVAA